jgi:serine/threonine protein kinase
LDGCRISRWSWCGARTLLRYCDEHKLPVKQRLELMAKICDAVQHAHQWGVIHCDLKPANILVTVTMASRRSPSDLEVIVDETGSAKFNLRMNPIEETFFLEKW